VPEPLIARAPHCVDNEAFSAAAVRDRAPARRADLRTAIGALDDDFVVLFAGKLTERKRPLDAVRAVATLGERAVLMVAGGGELVDAVREEARRLGVRLSWRGFLNQSELPSAFAAADAAIVPSAWETWGLIVNEALASGVPCVVTDHVAAAADLIVEHETGFVVPVGDIDGLAARLEAIRRAMVDGHDFAPACRQRVTSCSVGAATDGLVMAARRVRVRRGMPPSDNPGSPRVLVCCGHMVSLFGVERSALELLAMLREQGAAVHGIVNAWESSRIVARLEEIGASWSTASYMEPMRRRDWSVGRCIRVTTDVVTTSAALLRDAIRFRASIVLVPDFGSVIRNFPALLLLRLVGIGIVLKVGNAPYVSPFYRRLWRFGIGPATDVMVANSTFTAQHLEAVAVPARKIRIVHPMAPRRTRATTLVREKDPMRVIYVGQMTPPKGVDLLLDAIAELRRRGLDVSLDAVGDIEGWEPPGWVGYRASLRERASRPDLRGHVHFLGVREDVPALMTSSAVHCCPSRIECREAFGIVNLEAKLAGIPSVVFRSGALPELIEHGRNGWVCEEETASALADGLEHFLRDPNRREQAGRLALESSVRFSPDRSFVGWLEAMRVR
jgi:glycosyltransferase involved in cell wall biosynthesis